MYFTYVIALVAVERNESIEMQFVRRRRVDLLSFLVRYTEKYISV